VTAYDDVAHPQHHDGIFDSGGHAAILRGVGRNDVACVTADEQIARLRLHDMFGHHAGIGTGNHQRLGALAMAGQLIVERALVRKDLGLKTEHATDKLVHGFSILLVSCRSGGRPA